jgi:hypothetical protein
MVAGKGDPQSLRAEEMTDSMANLGDQLWRHSEEGKTAAIRLVALKYTTKCASKAKCTKRATILIEGRDRIGHPIWHRELCDEHAKPLIARARGLGIETYWHGDPPNERNAR